MAFIKLTAVNDEMLDQIESQKENRRIRPAFIEVLLLRAQSTDDLEVVLDLARDIARRRRLAPVHNQNDIFNTKTS